MHLLASRLNSLSTPASSSTPLRIAVTADPMLPVPPSHYGGIERIIHFLVEGLVARGHEVTLFADAQSHVSCELVPYVRARRPASAAIRNAALVSRRVLTGRFDVVHSFGRLAYLAPLAFAAVPKIMSYQRAITPSSVVQARRLFGRTIAFTACSRSMTAPVASLADWHVVHNGVPLDAYRFSPAVSSDAPLMFLGRLAPEKGAHVAIETARRAGRRLVIAGNIVDEHRDYFDQQIRPALDERITYVGPVDDVAKSDLLGDAAALLMPILWDEPFGIVMAEALACGTPVIGFDRASVPEVVTDGVTGFVARDVSGLVNAVARLDTIDRAACRADAEARFSAEVVIDAYEALYARSIADQRVGAAQPSSGAISRS